MKTHPLRADPASLGPDSRELLFNLIGKLGLHVDRKDLVRNTIPAIVVPFCELPFDFYELTKTYTALPTPVAIKLRHVTSDLAPVKWMPISAIMACRKVLSQSRSTP